MIAYPFWDSRKEPLVLRLEYIWRLGSISLTSNPLDSSSANASPAMALSTQHKRILLFHMERLQQSAIFLCWEMTENFTVMIFHQKQFKDSEPTMKFLKVILDTKVALFGMTLWKVAFESMKVNMPLSKIWDIWFWMVCCDNDAFFYLRWCQMGTCVSICACTFTCRCIWICFHVCSYVT